MEIEYNYLARNIKNLRTGMGMTQTELAELLRVENTTISNYEAGNSFPGIAKIAKLSEIFGYSVDSLVLKPLSQWRLRDVEKEYSMCTRSVMIYERLNDAKGDEAETMSYIVLSVNENADGRLIGVYMEDDSMTEAGINKGDAVIIRFQNTAADNDIAVIAEGDISYMGRYHDEENGKISISPESKNEKYKKRYFDLSDDNVEIIGIVVKAVVNCL